MQNLRANRGEGRLQATSLITPRRTGARLGGGAWRGCPRKRRPPCRRGGFAAGSNLILEIQQATADARRTIAVLSRDYSISPFAAPERGGAANRRCARCGWRSPAFCDRYACHSATRHRVQTGVSRRPQYGGGSTGSRRRSSAQGESRRRRELCWTRPRTDCRFPGIWFPIPHRSIQQWPLQRGRSG